jgi:outer membrane protein TolC
MCASRRIWGRVAAGFLATGIGTVVAQPPAVNPAVKAPTPVDEKAPPPRPAPGAVAAAKSILQPGEYPIDLATALRLAGAENPELLRIRARVSEVTAERQYAAAQLLPNLNLGTNYDQHRGALQQSNGNILQVNRDAMYYGLGANAIGAGTVNIPGLSYNLNVGEAWYGFLAARQRVTTARANADATRNEILLRV